jgi:hypothetical protein
MGFGTGGAGFGGFGVPPRGALQQYAQALLAAHGWAGQWGAFNSLVMGESGWNVHATNPTSGAYGIPQALPASKMASAGADWATSGYTQLRWMMGYLASVYGSPARAYALWLSRSPHWYGGGAYDVPSTGLAGLHRGEMVLPATLAAAVREALSGGGETRLLAEQNMLLAQQNRMLAELVRQGKAAPAGMADALDRSARRAAYGGTYSAGG